MKQYIKKTMVVGMCALVATSAFAAKKQKSVRIAYSTGSLCGAPMHIAATGGFFEEEFKKIGQTFELVPIVEGGPSAGELVASGKADASYGLLASQLQPMENGLPIAFTTGLHTGCTKYYVTKDSPINSVADLRGAKIGVPSLADSSVMHLKRKLADNGIGVTVDNNEVEFLAYASSDLPIALNKGAVDVIGLHDPVAAKGAEAYGFKKIFDIGTDEKFLSEYCCQSYVTLELIKKNPEGAAAYTRALQKAAAFIAEEPRAAAKIQLDNNLVSGDLDFNAPLLASYNFIPSRSLGKETFIKSATELQKVGIIKKSTNLKKFLDRGYADLKGVPDGYLYDPATKTYREIDRSEYDIVTGQKKHSSH